MNIRRIAAAAFAARLVSIPLGAAVLVELLSVETGASARVCRTARRAIRLRHRTQYR